MSMNKIEISLQVAQASGILGKAAALLLESGLRYGKHRQNADSSGHPELIIEAEGEHIERELLQSQLSEIEGVLEVNHILIAPKADATKVQLVQDTETELVADILRTWPNFIEQLQAFEDAQPHREREQKVGNLGKQIGRRMADLYPQLRDLDSIPAVLTDVIVPACQGIAQCKAQDNALMVPVSIFTKRLNGMNLLFHGEPDTCYFMVGFIQGLFDMARGLPPMKVQETRCKATGDSYCLFEVRPLA